MSITAIHLRKLLSLIDASEKELVSKLRADIRDEVAKEGNTEEKTGGDFHTPFWSDAKDHVIGVFDLSMQTKARVEDNLRRKRLYPALCKAFLKWWVEERRGTNQEIRPLAESVHGDYDFVDLKATVKVQNLLSLKIGDHEKLIYPYFSENPILSPDTARIGLWLMGEALEGHSINDMAILDVLRSKAYTINTQPLRGSEKTIFTENYRRILKKRRELRKDYP